METPLGSKSLPPGIRFYPTDEEICMFYLKRKVLGKSLGPQMMSEVDVLRFAPWELPGKACLKTKDLYWWFICPRLKKFPNAGRSNRSTVHGYWKATGNDKIVKYKNRTVGKIKTLIFHRGKPPKGDRTDWVMHEYRLEDRVLMEQGVDQESYVICKIYEKSGLGPKNGEQYGAPFVEEDWDSDNGGDLRGSMLCANTGQDASSPSTELQPEAASGGLLLTPEGSLPPTAQPPEASGGLPLRPVETEDDELDRLLAMFTDVDANQYPISGLLLTPVGSLPSTAQPPEASGGLLPPPVETEDDELDRLLAMFTDVNANQDPASKIFDGLEDLGGGDQLSEADLDWSQILSDHCYMELNDLQH